MNEGSNLLLASGKSESNDNSNLQYNIFIITTLQYCNIILTFAIKGQFKSYKVVLLNCCLTPLL